MRIDNIDAMSETKLKDAQGDVDVPGLSHIDGDQMRCLFLYRYAIKFALRMTHEPGSMATGIEV